MVQLKLTLKSKRPSTVYSANGKSYRLLPGSNVLNLEYEDYLALAKSLSIKPVQKEDPHEEPVKEDTHEEDREEPVKEEIPEEPHEEQVEKSHEEDSVKEEQLEESHEEPREEVIEEPVNEESHSDDGYSSWSYSELKAEYKNITGKSCKLKKEEIIKFLQENKDNVE